MTDKFQTVQQSSWRWLPWHPSVLLFFSAQWQKRSSWSKYTRTYNCC